MQKAFATFVRSLTREDNLRDLDSVNKTRAAAFGMMLLGAGVLFFVCGSVLFRGFNPAANILAVPGSVFFIVGVVWGRMAGMMERIVLLEQALKDFTGIELEMADRPKSIALPWLNGKKPAEIQAALDGLK